MYEYEYRPLVWILLIEFALILVFIVLAFCHRAHIKFKVHQVKKYEAQISHEILERLKHPEKRTSWNRTLFKHTHTCLKVLEAFNLRFKDEHWTLVKKEIIEAVLLPKARKVCRSIFWKKRSFAARIFALLPAQMDENKILKLLDDRKFLVQSKAAVALIDLESELGVQKILDLLQKYQGFAQYFLEDALQRGSREVTQLCIKYAEKKKWHKTCLKVLAGRCLGTTVSFLEQDLFCKDLEIRLLAMDILAHNPTKHAVDIFTKFSKEEDKKVQKQAIWGLGLVEKQESVDRLQELLLVESDHTIQVEAAKSLKRLGREDLLDEMANKHHDLKPIIMYVRQFG